MKNKTSVFFLSIFFIMTLILPLQASATDNNEEFEQQILEFSGANDLDTGSAKDYLDEYGISLYDAQSIENIDIKTVFGAVLNIFIENIQMPLKLFLSTLGTVFLMAGVNAGAQAVNSTNAIQYKSVGVLVSCAIISAPISSVLESVCVTVTEGTDFLSGFVPLFSALTLFSGSASVSYAYSTAMLCFCGFASKFASEILLPLLSCCLALSIVDSVSPVLKLSAVANAVKKLAITLLGFSMVIFIGILSLQTSVASSMDNVALRAGKYVVSSAIPIVGSAVGEAYSSINASIGVLRNASGAFGILAVAFIVLPVLATAFLSCFALKLAVYASDAFGINELSALFGNICNVLETAIAVLVSFFVMVLICSAIVMVMLGG